MRMTEPNGSVFHKDSEPTPVIGGQETCISSSTIQLVAFLPVQHDQRKTIITQLDHEEQSFRKQGQRQDHLMILCGLDQPRLAVDLRQATADENRSLGQRSGHDPQLQGLELCHELVACVSRVIPQEHSKFGCGSLRLHLDRERESGVTRLEVSKCDQAYGLVRLNDERSKILIEATRSRR